MRWLLRGLSLAVLFAALAATTVRGDVLVGTNGEHFVGKVIEETADSVVFESELGGRLTVPRARIQELQRTNPGLPAAPPPNPDQRTPGTNAASIVPSPSAVAETPTTLFWVPPSIGYDKADWIQLKSGEWLRGQLRFIEQKNLEFDSDELDEHTFKLKDIRQAYPAEPMWAKFDNREPAFGKIVISNDFVSVLGPEQLSLPRDQLLGITPSGARGSRNWSGSLNLGLSLQSGNKQLISLTANGELARRTPNTTMLLDYIGNFSQLNSVQNANNQRVNTTYDFRLDRHWFVRPVGFEYFHDAVANISMRDTVSLGGGYYIFDRQGLEWTVSAGPAYQYTKFETVEPGQADSTATPAGVLQSKFKVDFTSRLDLTINYRGTVTSEEAGVYTHHTESILSFEIKRHLNLDVSFIWDYLQNPQVESDGNVPQKSDYYLTVGLGVRF